jgi:hypothetical protein
MAKMNDKLKEFAKLLSEELKKTKVETQKILQEDTPIQIIAEKENTADLVASYLSKKVELKEQDNIEQNRWNDPLKQTDKKFVTFKDMNDHYGLFLQRIQQQMSSMGGGGEVKFARLDDISSSTAGTNKYLTYNQSTKKFYFNTIETSDGIYLNGNNEVTLNVASPTVLGGIKIGPGFAASANGEISLNAGPMFEMDESDVFQLSVATETQFGGVKLGPGVVTNGIGQIIIDSTGLDFSFGDFGASVGTYSSNTDYAILQAINDDEDIVIASNGTGGVNVVGQFHVHPTDGSLTVVLEEEPVFEVNATGQVVMRITQGDDQSGGVEIIGSSTGDTVPPGIDGTMLHITGQIEDPCRVYFDGNGDYVSLVARRWNGNFLDGRTAVLVNDDVLRINATAQTNVGMGNVSMAQIRMTALENQTTTAQGSKIVFTVTPIGSAATSRVDVATISVADGITATKFTGPLTGDVTGNASGTAGSVAAANVTGTTLASNVVTSSLTTVGTLTNLTVTNTISGSINGNANTATTSTNLSAATSILAGSISIDPTSINKTSARTLTFTLTGLTTSHKIVITSGTALPYGLMIAGAWASALNTLSIVFHNYGGNVDQGATNIQYFAWV